MSSQRIADELRKRIESGELKPGARVPSTRQIVRSRKVATATAQKALAILKGEGLVRAVPGKGTLVDQKLSQERVVRAAIEIADKEGLPAVSMRRIAHELGVATMSLYRYVPGKDELLMLVADAVFGEAPLPKHGLDGWRPRVETAARLQWDLYRKHPWLAGALSLSRPQLVPNGMVHTEWILQAFDGFGLPRDVHLVLALTIVGYVRGAAINIEMDSHAEQDTGISNEAYLALQEAEFRAIVASGRFPTLVHVSAEPKLDAGLDRLFEFGLARLLDGIDVYLTSQPKSAVRSRPDRERKRAATK